MPEESRCVDGGIVEHVRLVVRGVHRRLPRLSVAVLRRSVGRGLEEGDLVLDTEFLVEGERLGRGRRMVGVPACEIIARLSSAVVSLGHRSI